MKYLAFALPGREPLHNDVPLRDVELTRGPGEAQELQAVLEVNTAHQEILVEGTGETVELMRERGTLIIAWDGVLARSFIVESVEPDSEEQQQLTIQAFGHGSVADGTPWDSSKIDYVEADPLDITRDIWKHITSFPDMIDITLDSTSSPIRIGEEEQDVEFTTGEGEAVSFQSGPHRVNWWSTTDLGSEFSDLATETPFEWREETIMDPRADTPPEFRIRLGYPILKPADRTDTHHFEVGLNVVAPEPSSEDEDQYFSEIYVLGGGEGSDKTRSHQTRQATRLRTPRVVEDQGISSSRLADEEAREAITRMEGHDKFWQTVTVLPHPAARPGTYGEGDIIQVKGDTAWGWHEQRCRIVRLSHTLATDTVNLTLEPWQ